MLRRVVELATGFLIAASILATVGLMIGIAVGILVGAAVLVVNILV